MKRLFDFVLAIFCLFTFLIPFLLLLILILFISKDPIFYWSERVGYMNKVFLMPKLRTMKVETPSVGSNQLIDASNYVTPLGSFLRKTSIDELPQIWSIIKGDMSFVGPRPALVNEFDLIEYRNKALIYKIRPGLTGLAQISGRDHLSVKEKVKYDSEYMLKSNLWFDLVILFKTLPKIIKGEGIMH
jgi:O-antigen biosynthesis protein WbqP